MLKIFLALFVVFLFTGCLSEVKPPDNSVKPNEKAFEQEDSYILFALRAEELKEYDAASSIFNTLWEKSDKKEYLYKSLQNALANGSYEQVVVKVDEVSDENLTDSKLIRLKIIALIGSLRFEQARVLSIVLVEKTKEVNDYILVSEIYVKQKKYDTALKYLESAYTKNYNEKILNRMSIILYVNLRRNRDAIAQLETHTRVHGCSKIICTRLIGFYSNENNIEGLLSVYLRMYELEKNDKVAKQIIQIYTYQKDYIKLMSFLQKSSSDDDLLLQIYINSKIYTKAYILAEKLYTQTGNLSYLGQSAIFEYESSIDRNDKKMQARVIEKLKKVVSMEKKPLYLNYLGYLLIDHSIDVKEGMAYVREALKIHNDSAFYLDSLAWGYYKLGDCEKALEIINRVSTLDGGDNPEVISHIKTINKCKNKKGKNKK